MSIEVAHEIISANIMRIWIWIFILITPCREGETAGAGTGGGGSQRGCALEAWKQITHKIIDISIFFAPACPQACLILFLVPPACATFVFIYATHTDTRGLTRGVYVTNVCATRLTACPFWKCRGRGSVEGSLVAVTLQTINAQYIRADINTAIKRRLQGSRRGSIYRRIDNCWL